MLAIIIAVIMSFAFLGLLAYVLINAWTNKGATTINTAPVVVSTHLKHPTVIARAPAPTSAPSPGTGERRFFYGAIPPPIPGPSQPPADCPVCPPRSADESTCVGAVFKHTLNDGTKQFPASPYARRVMEKMSNVTRTAQREVCVMLRDWALDVDKALKNNSTVFYESMGISTMGVQENMCKYISDGLQQQKTQLLGIFDASQRRVFEAIEELWSELSGKVCNNGDLLLTEAWAIFYELALSFCS